MVSEAKSLRTFCGNMSGVMKPISFHSGSFDCLIGWKANILSAFFCFHLIWGYTLQDINLCHIICDSSFNNMLILVVKSLNNAFV